MLTSDASDDDASDGEVDVPARLAAHAMRWAAEGWTADDILHGCRTEPEGHTTRLEYCAKPWAPKPSLSSDASCMLLWCAALDRNAWNL